MIIFLQKKKILLSIINVFPFFIPPTSVNGFPLMFSIRKKELELRDVSSGCSFDIHAIMDRPDGAILAPGVIVVVQ